MLSEKQEPVRPIDSVKPYQRLVERRQQAQLATRPLELELEGMLLRCLRVMGEGCSDFAAWTEMQDLRRQTSMSLVVHGDTVYASKRGHKLKPKIGCFL